MRVWTLVAVVVVVVRGWAGAAKLAGFRESGVFGERVREGTLEHGVRLHTNVAGDFDAARPTHHVIYLLPNGNTIEWTLGRRLGAGDDWHFDIQHIAAQVRLMREMDRGRNVVLSLLEAPGRSWPKFRADHPKDNPELIRGYAAAALDGVPGKAGEVTLVAHSGGGSCIFGYVNHAEAIPAYVKRIVFLDANYAYSTEEHGEKLVGWLGASKENRLVVFAYDDRDVTLNGKKIVSETGGTYRATGRMVDFFEKQGGEGERGKVGPFEHRSFVGGQAQFFVHPNPELKILHTTMIGEMNAFLHAMLLGTEGEGKYGVLGGPRAFVQYVEAPPATRPAEGVRLKLPERPAGAVTGSALLEQVKSMSTAEREEVVIGEVLRGNVPGWLREMAPVSVTAAGPDGQHTGTYWVTPDYLAVGSDEDYFRMPLTPMAAQRVASAVGCSMVTRKMSNDIYANATVKLDPRPLTKEREAAGTFWQHHRIIEEQLAAVGGWTRGQLVAGHKKDVVITPRLAERAGKVAIYGWHKLDGRPIQPLYLGHVDWYVDYSHGIRLVSREVLVDGKRMGLGEVMGDAGLCALVSDEGVVRAEYPSTKPAAK